MLNSLLIATDFSPTANRVIEFAVPLAVSLDLEVHVLHVDEEGAVYGLSDHVQAAAFLAEVGARRDAWLADLAHDIEEAGARCVCARRSGLASEQIALYAEQQGIDLLAIGRVGQTRVSPLLTGSTFKQATRRVSASILCATRDSRIREANPLVQRILVPIDFSDPSRQAARLGAWLAQQLEARLDLLHVLQLPTRLAARPDEPPLSLPPHIAEAMERRFAEELAGIAAELPLERVDYGIDRGTDAADVICQHALDTRADLIVMPRTGAGRIHPMALGRVVEDVIQVAPVPVLVVAPERVKAEESPDAPAAEA